ncbi:putative NACHT family NTPase [Rhodopseudomonas rhenobacensis]|uniref:Putative NACHT family NTPase n=1 Tax=Rhodopseudomonas rhenobacensis TaxID=87461 RepID=A0A7W8DY40_9BRAD|nr:ATP-binding protein [Rhodopseudomonas rhenobacensis]MBB5045486.1 putative NACHT family NTPase [Rhodopseudomonas rhenobacensis]
MTRIVRQTNAAPGKEEEAKPRTFSDFAGEPNLVLLGDPGSGKTHLFKEAAATEGARFLKARAFLNMPAHALAGQALFIDGLDEKRGGRSDQGIIDALVSKLWDVKPARVRISCRVADWLGESDFAALRPYFDQHGDAPVLQLDMLSAAEQREVLAGQGVEDAVADGFLVEAEERGLADFLENPQNLIMLWRAVQTGSWPATRTQLFEMSTGLMLQECNQEHARSGGGSLSVAELRPVAGAICAARLISDVDAVSLTDQEGTADIPGYRSVSFFAPEMVQAALGRRVFDAGAEAETVDYAHRTTAEFLAAEFLARLVREGLPFGRVLALMGVDGHPAAELRGLHAWLAVHLPEHADELIEADPYGVLTYGDAASLAPSSCACLVQALDRLSKENPWFRSGNWQSRSIGALARPDMIGEFRAILNNPASASGIRSVVVDALMLGTPLSEMLPDLVAVLVRQNSPFAERAHALAALLRLDDPGKAALRDACQTQLGNTSNEVRLRAEIITQLYGHPFGVADVVTLIGDCLDVDDMAGSGLLWTLADKLPESDVPEILDGIAVPMNSGRGFDRRVWEVAAFYARILVRAWRSPVPFDPGRALEWLRKRAALKGGTSESRARGLRDASRDAPERMTAIARHFLRTVIIDEDRWLSYNRFREALLLEPNVDTLLDISAEEMAAAEPGERQVFLYEIALSLSYHAGHPHAATVFETLWSRGTGEAALATALARAIVTNLPPDYFAGRSSREEVDVEESREQQRQDFDRDFEQIRSGVHMGWLKHLGMIYFAHYGDVERAATPRERLAAWLGEERTGAALDALMASLSRNDLPSYADVMALAAQHQHYDWWSAMVAGMNERWASGQDLSGLSDDFLRGMLAFDITCPVSQLQDGTEHWIVHPWRKSLTERRPEFVRDVYLAVLRLRLSRNEQFSDGLSELLTEAAFEPYRADIVLGLLREFPNASPYRLDDLLAAALKLPAAHQEFLVLAQQVRSGAIPVEHRQRDLWLASAYVLAPASFEQDVGQRARAHPDFIFDLRDKGGFGDDRQPSRALAVPVAEFIARLAGSLFPETPHPSDGWSGNTNAWDAADYIRSLINVISASPSEVATDALSRLNADPGLTSYRPHILHALANQRQRRRDAEYDRPDWPQAIAALRNAAPSTVADLYALLVAHLRGLAHSIARANTDIFKQFWNLDSYARTAEPRPEEACRDNLVTLLRPSLLPLGITAEPEGHMVADKRADISVSMPSRKILCELKRDYHAEVWTAIEGQLERFYAHDPDARGFGIYCVFWFGRKKPHGIPPHPKGLAAPQSPGEMEQMLRDLMPERMRSRLTVIVIDVSGEV